MGNVLGNPKIGMLFIDFQRGNRLRLHGEASIDMDDPIGDWEGAQFVASASEPLKSIRTARATSTECSRSNVQRSSRGQIARRQFPGGSAAIGRSTCSPKVTPHSILAQPRSRSLPWPGHLGLQGAAPEA